eukprot:m.576469 g.576469  ORF g.576469 m.576469 type:complete len:71 (+) comp22285_c0_seq74:365-577(+)
MGFVSHLDHLCRSDEHEPLTYDEIDSDVPSDSREEYEQLQETYDTVAEDRSELQALGAIVVRLAHFLPDG